MEIFGTVRKVDATGRIALPAEMRRTLGLTGGGPEDGETYWHIIDPATGYPAKSGLASVTVVSESGVEAGALWTR